MSAVGFTPYCDNLSFENISFSLYESQSSVALCSPLLRTSSLEIGSSYSDSTEVSLTEQMEAFKNRRMEEWNNEDWLDWALFVCREENIHHADCPITIFSSIPVQKLLSFQEKDFRWYFGAIYGSVFYRKRLEIECIQGKQITERKSYTTLQSMSPSLTSMDSFDSNFTLQDDQSTEFLSTACEALSFSPKSNTHNTTSPDLSSIGTENYFGTDSYFTNSFFQTENSAECLEDQTFQSQEESTTFLYSMPQEPCGGPGTEELPLFDAVINLPDLNKMSPLFDNEEEEEEEEKNLDGNHLDYGTTAMPEQNPEVSNEGISSHWFEKIRTGGPRKNRVRNPKSWEFLLRLLQDPKSNPSLVTWVSFEEGEFKLVQKEAVSEIWGQRTSDGKNSLSYESFARLLRHHYKNIMVQVKGKQMVYKFSPQVIEAIKNGKKF